MKALTFLFLVWCALPSFAQDQRLHAITVSDGIASAAVDRPGDFYIQTTSGQLQHLDKSGRLLAHIPNNPPITLFDPRDGARLFAYYRGQQQFAFLNPSLETVATYSLNPAFAADPWLVCVSGDYNLWILDAADLSLKKVDKNRDMVVAEEPLTAAVGTNKDTFTSLREYQGFVFLLEQGKGIHIYSSMGKYIRMLQAPEARYFNFLGEGIYYIHQGKLITFDLFSAETRETPLQKTADIILLTDERLMTIRGKTLEIYEYKP
jgi:hypothetical protein